MDDSFVASDAESQISEKADSDNAKNPKPMDVHIGNIHLPADAPEGHPHVFRSRDITANLDAIDIMVTILYNTVKIVLGLLLDMSNGHVYCEIRSDSHKLYKSPYLRIHRLGRFVNVSFLDREQVEQGTSMTYRISKDGRWILEFWNKEGRRPEVYKNTIDVQERHIALALAASCHVGGWTCSRILAQHYEPESEDNPKHRNSTVEAGATNKKDEVAELNERVSKLQKTVDELARSSRKRKRDEDDESDG